VYLGAAGLSTGAKTFTKVAGLLGGGGGGGGGLRDVESTLWGLS
jgi:hypothetical protein